MMDETDHRPPRRSYWMPAIAVIILFALALRVFYAWTMQYMGNEDHCLVALMAKHMAEGRDFPVFFYGQPYMGSLEPAVSAVLVWLFGSTTFMVYLGTALTGLLVLPLLYLFGRDADSRWAGLLAMVYVTIMPEFVTYFFIVPRGGYMTMMVTGITALWLACRIATDVRAGRRVSPWTYAALGVLAGLGWWSNQLVIAFLIAACIVLLIAFRPNMLAGVLPGLLGFVLGGLPWWLWNITHEWGSFDFAGTFGKVELDEGMQSLWQQFLVLAGFDPIDPWWSKVRAALFLGVLAGYVWIIIRDRAMKVDEGRFHYRVALPILVTVMILLYARSHYARFNGAHRYLLPMLPAFAVMAGVVCSRIMARKSVAAGMLLFAAILPAYTPGLHKSWQTMLAERETFTQAQKVADELAPLCDGVALGDWVRFHWMNFASSERLCVARLPNERYAPYAIRAELAERPAVLGDFKRFQTFLEATQGSSKQGGVERFRYDYDIRPPSNNWRYADGRQIESAADSNGKLALDAVTDLCLDTGWSDLVVKRTNIVATFTFRKPLPLCGVRFLSLSERYPTYMTIQGQRRIESTWKTLVPHQRATCYFWSGDYAQVDGLQYFQELRFAAPKGGVKRLTITFDVGDADIPYPFDIAEIRFLQEAPSAAGEKPPSVESCIAALGSTGTRRFYAPRWLAARVWAAAPGRFETTAPGNLKRTVNDLTARDTTIPEPVSIRGVTSFICDRRDAEPTRSVLKSRGFEWSETDLDRYVLLTLTGPAELLRAGHPSTMYWTELGCFRMENARSIKENADWLYRRLLEKPADASDRLDGLRQVIRLYPGHQPARKMLAAELEKAGLHAEAEEQAAELRRQTVPEISAPMKFSDGVELLGLTLSSREVPRGGKLVIQYCWRCPPAVLRKKLPAVFVHFANGGEMFQDDHRVLGTADRKEIEFQPFDEVLVETRAVNVPSSAAPGEYEIRMGRKSRVWRSSVDTELPQSRRAVELPVRLTVVP